MKRNLLSGYVKAALMADAIATAVNNNAKVAGIAHASNDNRPPQLPEAPGERRIHLMPEVEEAVREAALKLPRKQAMRDLAAILQADLDRELTTAVGIAIGMELTDLDQLHGHTFERVTIEGEEGESFLLDGRRILWVGPVTVNDDGEQVTVDRPIRRIKAATEAP